MGRVRPGWGIKIGQTLLIGMGIQDITKVGGGGLSWNIRVYPW